MDFEELLGEEQPMELWSRPLRGLGARSVLVEPAIGGVSRDFGFLEISGVIRVLSYPKGSLMGPNE